MSRLARSVTRVVLVLMMGGFAGCDNLSTGPSLSNVTMSALGKEATTDQRDPRLCCCRATGTVTNRNSVPVYLTMTVTAIDLFGAPIFKVGYFIPDVAPGQTARMDVPGFAVPCVSIDRFVPEVKVRGLTEPPL
jgi:hypothetical protein